MMTLGTAKYRPRYLVTIESLLGRVIPAGSANEAQPLQRLPRSLLLAKAVGLGDGVMIRSIAEHLSHRHPGLRIGVLVCPPCRDVMSCNSEFTVHCIDPKRDGPVQIAHELFAVRRAAYEASIDFEMLSLLSAVFIRMAGIPVRIGFQPPIKSARAGLLTHPVRLEADNLTWRNFVRLARVFDAGLREDLCTFPMPGSPSAENYVKAWWSDHAACRGQRFVAIHLGTGERALYRRWPVERFVSLAELVRAKAPQTIIVLTGTDADRDLTDAFARCYSGRIVDATELNSLERTALLLQRCDLLVCGDTGVMHLAAAMGTPTVGLFGPSIVGHWAPVGVHATAVYTTREPCSPCMDSYRGLMPDSCSNAQWGRCMLDIEVEAVLNAALRVVRGGWLG